MSSRFALSRQTTHPLFIPVKDMRPLRYILGFKALFFCLWRELFLLLSFKADRTLGCFAIHSASLRSTVFASAAALAWALRRSSRNCEHKQARMLELYKTGYLAYSGVNQSHIVDPSGPIFRGPSFKAHLCRSIFRGSSS